MRSSGAVMRAVGGAGEGVGVGVLDGEAGVDVGAGAVEGVGGLLPHATTVYPALTVPWS